MSINCRWRGGAKPTGRYGCSSPKLLVHASGVRDEDCARCHCRDHPAAGEKPAEAPARIGLCVFYVDAKPAPVRDGSGRDWRVCEHTPSYGIVCPCKTCGPSCPGYKTDVQAPAPG
jgi:hypothetical protein